MSGSRQESWFILADGRETGPWTLADLQARLAAGSIGSQTLVRQALSVRFVVLWEFRDRLGPVAAALPPPPLPEPAPVESWLANQPPPGPGPAPSAPAAVPVPPPAPAQMVERVILRPARAVQAAAKQIVIRPARRVVSWAQRSGHRSMTGRQIALAAGLALLVGGLVLWLFAILWAILFGAAEVISIERLETGAVGQPWRGHPSNERTPGGVQPSPELPQRISELGMPPSRAVPAPSPPPITPTPAIAVENPSELQMETAASQSSVVPPIEPTPIDPRLTAAQAQLQADLDATRQQVGEALRGDSLSDLQAARRRLADLRQAGERYRRAAAAAGQNASQIDDHLERAGFHAVLALDLDLRNRITRLSQGRRR